MRFKQLFASALLAVLLVAPGAVAQDPEQSPDDTPLELSAYLVTITVVVRDADGGLVSDLGPSDFVVYEDGLKQEIDKVFHEDEVPLRLAMLFDASKSVAPRIDYEKRAAKGFFGAAIKPGDQAALYSVSDTVKLEQRLTGSVGTLVDTLEKLTAQGRTAFHDAIKTAGADLTQAQGRRVIVALSDGYDTSSRSSFEKALESAQLADTVVYCISPAGSGDALAAHAKLGLENMRRLSVETGGAAFFPPVETKRWQEEETLRQIYKQITDELRAQIVITYYSSSQSGTNKFHELKVSANRPGLTVTARKGFYDKANHE